MQLCCLLFNSDLHRNIICAPHDGAEVAYCKAVADEVDVAGLLGKRSGDIARAADDGVTVDVDVLTVLAGADDRAVLDFLECRLKIDGSLVQGEPLSEIRGVCKADAGLADKVVLHLDNDRILALESELVGYFASGQSAADNSDGVADFCAVEVVAALDHLLVAGNSSEESRGRSGRNDDGIAAERRDVLYLVVESDFDAELRHLASVPVKQVAELALV